MGVFGRSFSNFIFTPGEFATYAAERFYRMFRRLNWILIRKEMEENFYTYISLLHHILTRSVVFSFSNRKKMKKFQSEIFVKFYLFITCHVLGKIIIFVYKRYRFFFPVLFNDEYSKKKNLILRREIVTFLLEDISINEVHNN